MSGRKNIEVSSELMVGGDGGRILRGWDGGGGCGDGGWY